jgi:hypothetical protein
MSITAVFEKLGSRLRQRTTSAQETIERSAQSLAAGDTVDTGAVEGALVTAGISLDEYRARVDFHVERRKRLDELDKLGPARTRLEALDKQIAAENAKHAEIVEAYRKRWTSLRDQADQAGQQVDQSRSARDWLLDVKHAPLFLRDEYVAALDGEQRAIERVADVERSIREIKAREKDATGWIAQLLEEDLREIHPPMATVAKSQRDKLGAAQRAKVEEHERRRDRAARELVDAEKDLTAARADLAKAEAVLVDIRKRILNV